MKDYSFWLQDEINESKMFFIIATKSKLSDDIVSKIKKQVKGHFKLSNGGRDIETEDKNTFNSLKEVMKTMDIDFDPVVEKMNESKDYKAIEEACKTKIKESDDYKEYFQKKLKEYKVESPDELSDEDKKKFYDDVDAGWEGDNEDDEKMNEAMKLPDVISGLEKMKHQFQKLIDGLPDDLYNKRAMKNSVEKVHSSIDYIIDGLKSGKYNS